MIKRILQTFFLPKKTVRENRGVHETFLSHPKLLDIAHEVLAKDALEKKLALSALEKQGWPYLQRQRFTETVRAKVKKFLRWPLDGAEENEMIEEITERITEVAEADPRVNRLFGDAGKMK